MGGIEMKLWGLKWNKALCLNHLYPSERAFKEGIWADFAMPYWRLKLRGYNMVRVELREMEGK